MRDRRPEAPGEGGPAAGGVGQRIEIADPPQAEPVEDRKIPGCKAQARDRQTGDRIACRTRRKPRRGRRREARTGPCGPRRVGKTGARCDPLVLQPRGDVREQRVFAAEQVRDTTGIEAQAAVVVLDRD